MKIPTHHPSLENERTWDPVFFSKRTWEEKSSSKQPHFFFGGWGGGDASFFGRSMYISVIFFGMTVTDQKQKAVDSAPVMLPTPAVRRLLSLGVGLAVSWNKVDKWKGFFQAIFLGTKKIETSICDHVWDEDLDIDLWSCFWNKKTSCLLWQSLGTPIFSSDFGGGGGEIPRNSVGKSFTRICSQGSFGRKMFWKGALVVSSVLGSKLPCNSLC